MPADSVSRSNGEESSVSDVCTESGPDASSQVGPMPIVGIGASAGGVEALCQFFRHLPTSDEEGSMAFVVVLHLSADHESNLVEILQDKTTLDVVRAEEGKRVVGGTVYVITPGVQLTIAGGRLRVERGEGPHDPASTDRFFRSLAADQGSNAVGIVLSGTGADGTLGLRAIKEEGGVTMVQSPDEAGYGSMPQSAIATGLVDLVRPVGDIAKKLVEYRSHAGVIQLPEVETELKEEERSTLMNIFHELHATSGVDFSQYNRSTALRRLERRLQLRGVDTLEAYLELLRTDSEEAAALRKDFLISVTNFFRGPEAFEALADTVIPTLFADKGPSDQVRVWVPGTATGEEAYSLAMLLVEHAEQMEDPPDLQVFATDVDPEALSFARQGRYPKTIAADLPIERLERFFHLKENAYQVHSGLSDIVLFAEHNVLEDPPFSDLDLVSCRNLLIYLSKEVQEQVYELLHYGLRDDGYLFLGPSEGSGASDDLFSMVDSAHNILQARVLSTNRPRVPIRSSLLQAGREQRRGGNSFPASRPRAGAADDESTVQEVHRRALMAEVSSLLVDENHNIVHLSGEADRYLEFEKGTPTRDLFSCVPTSLCHELRGMFEQVLDGREEQVHTECVMEITGTPRRVHVAARPVQENGATYVHVRFEDRGGAADDAPPSEEGDETAQLKAKLEGVHKRLQRTREEYEAATEEMETSNEELLSMNEELKSKNEELDTAKEELQSTNQELELKIEEERRARCALENLIEATQIPTLFLDENLKIQRFTPPVTDLFNLQPEDVRRSLSDFSGRFQQQNLLTEARRVLREQVPVEREVRTEDDEWYVARLRPYHTLDGEMDGVVLTFVDITERRLLERQLVDAAEQERQRIGQDLHDILSSDLAALTMKISNYKHRLEEEETVAFDLEPLQGFIDQVRSAAEQARTLSHALVPVALGEGNLAAALDKLCCEQEKVGALTYTFEGDREEPLPSNNETAMHMYRIAHEAMVNARTHAEAEHVWAWLHREHNQLVMGVRDDGKGLPDDLDQAKGLGLRTMQYRANLIGATLAFEEGPEGGGLVRCALSLEDASRA